MAFDDFAADSQSDAGAGNVAAVKALEHVENAVVILGRYSFAVVSQAEHVLIASPFGSDADFRRAFPAPVLDGVAHEVLHQLDELNLIAPDRRAGSGNRCVAWLSATEASRFEMVHLTTPVISTAEKIRCSELTTRE